MQQIQMFFIFKCAQNKICIIYENNLVKKNNCFHTGAVSLAMKINY